MAAASISWSNQDDSSSFTGTIYTTSSSSTVPGPGAITGKFLKALGERSLDLVVNVVIRSRLAAIERTLEKSPHILRNPTGEKEWRRMNDAYNDLHELCRESRSEYYPMSLQRAATILVWDITLITRPALETFIPASPTNEKWEALLARVQRREELQEQTPTATGSSRKRRLISFLKSNSGNIEIGARVPPISKSSSSSNRLDPTRKVLVLGVGGVGKSTVVKQIQATVDGFPNSLPAEPFREIIIFNILDSMKNILSDVDPSELSEHARKASLLFSSFDCPSKETNHSLREATTTLLCEPAVRRSARRARLGLLAEPGLESADYFFSSLDRLFAEEYEPSYEDFIRSRVRTTGIHENALTIGDFNWKIVDTGGERSERRKWLNCFVNVGAIIYVVALSDYNKTLSETANVNRMEESLTLFYSIVNSRWFTRSLIVLLFNKVDVFQETLEYSPLKDYYPDYAGEDFDDACQYFERRFLLLAQNQERPLVIKYGCAINSAATIGTFRSIKDEINLHYLQYMKIL